MVGLCSDELTCQDLTCRGYTRSTRNKFLAQGDCSWEVHCSVEALAEIFDFAAGLVHSSKEAE